MIGWLSIDTSTVARVKRLVGILQVPTGRWRAVALLDDGSRHMTRTRSRTLQQRLRRLPRGMTGLLWLR